jgi:hypothetical protein
MRTVLAALFVSLLAATAKDAPRINGLHAHREESMVLVSFELVGAFDQPVLDRIRSGLPTQFEYEIRLERPRGLWFGNNLGRTKLQIAVTYNAVTQEYLVNTKQDGRLIDSRIVSDAAELERAMTMVHSLPAFEVDREQRGRWVVSVRAVLGSRHVLLLFRNTIHTNWARYQLAQAAPAIE